MTSDNSTTDTGGGGSIKKLLARHSQEKMELSEGYLGVIINSMSSSMENLKVRTLERSFRNPIGIIHLCSATTSAAIKATSRLKLNKIC